MTLLLGIDIGTSSAKAALYDAETAYLVAVAGHEYPVFTPAPGAAEQVPDEWWQAVVRVVRDVTARAGTSSTIAGIGLSGQMHSTVLLDKGHTPIQPAIIWADQRSGAASAELAARVGTERFAAIGGTLPAAGFMASTLYWLRSQHPALLDNTRHILLPKDYVRLRLTGDVATDPSDAASTALFDISRKDWSAELIAAVGVSADLLPPVRASTAVAGSLLSSAASELGLAPDIPVVTGCADQPAQAIACGLLAPGTASVTTGSGGQVFVPLQPPASGSVPTDARLHVFNHAEPDMYYVLGAILSAGLALRWLRRIANLEGRADAYTHLSAAAAAVPPGADGLLFLPYLLGERTPHMDSLVRGSFIGLSYQHDLGYLARAVMEGVAFALRQALEISQSLTGSLQGLIGSGGGMESQIWRQIQTDVFGLPLRKTLVVEQAAVGAALLAGVGAGIFNSLSEACEQAVRLDQPTEPIPENHRLYNERYEQFCQLYPLLRPVFHRHGHALDAPW